MGIRWTRRKYTYTLPGWAWAVVGFATLAFLSGVVVAVIMKLGW